MLDISDPERYARYEERRTGSFWEFVLWALLFGSVGGIAWAIRGTDGWGGIDGTIVPGMAWGLLWYWACRCRGIDARGVALWLGLGIAIGGEWGYGQYVSWIRGTFYVTDEQTIPIAPQLGYLWFILVGVAWGAPGGIALGWVLSGKQSLHRWLMRIVLPLGAALLGRMLIQARPEWFFPNYSPELYAPEPGTSAPLAHFFQTQDFMIWAWGVCVALVALSWVLARLAQPLRAIGHGLSILGAVYSAFLVLWMGWWVFIPQDGLGLFDGELGKHLGRTFETNAQNAIVVAWFVGALVVAALQRDKWTLVMGLIIGGGFGIGMVIGALWCLGFVYAEGYIDWWKMWEVQAGFNLGVLYTIALYWTFRQIDKHHRAERGISPETVLEAVWTRSDAWWRPLASAAGVTLIWAYLFFEDDLVASLLLGPLYMAAVCWVSSESNDAGGPGAVRDRQKSLSLVFSVFYFLFILFHGATSRLGVFLELYDPKDVGQYQWPWDRIWLFLPAAIIIVAVTLYKTWQIVQRRSSPLDPTFGRATLHTGNLIMLLGIVGAVSIWPAEIGAVYALVLFIAMFAFMRLVLRYQNGEDRETAVTPQ
jgi:hypothetical protein